ncbi:oxidoreductase [Mycobacterium tuberculosis]|nr:oxidoreductase [Mycobacterium tuberculosis]
MSRLADRAKSYPLASFGAALLPPELGGPLPAQFVQRVDRYVTRLPATSRFAVRAGLASLAAASYLTTGRSLPRLHPDERARVLHRIAALSPEVAAAVEGLKAIVLLANGADTYAHELLARAQEHDAARPDAELTVILSADSPSVTRADAVVVGSGAGGATGRLRGVEGVWVADASILPSCPEVNPQLSIMAMALAVADQTVAKVVGVR